MRSFSKSLFDKYNFIEYSQLTDSVYCFPCRMFGKNESESCFTKAGFKNWKKTEKIAEHAVSKFHRDNVEAYLQWKSLSRKGDVMQQQQNYHTKLIAENREYIRTLARTAIFCGRQSISLRGHDESENSANKGNYLEAIDLLYVESKQFREKRDKMPSNATYLSSDSQNALVESGARCVLSAIQKK
jgi:hypothetical protein